MLDEAGNVTLDSMTDYFVTTIGSNAFRKCAKAERDEFCRVTAQQMFDILHSTSAELKAAFNAEVDKSRQQCINAGYQAGKAVTSQTYNKAMAMQLKPQQKDRVLKTVNKINKQIAEEAAANKQQGEDSNNAK